MQITAAQGKKTVPFFTSYIVKNTQCAVGNVEEAALSCFAPENGKTTTCGGNVTTSTKGKGISSEREVPRISPTVNKLANVQGHSLQQHL